MFLGLVHYHTRRTIPQNLRMAMILLRGTKYLTDSVVSLRYSAMWKSSDESRRVKELYYSEPIGCQIAVKGWVRAVRKMKDHTFADVNDGSCSRMLQVVVPKACKPASLSCGAAIKAVGTLVKNANEEIELKADNIEVIGPCIISDGYPFAPRKSYSAEYIRKYLHFRPRTNAFGALLRIRDAASRLIEEFFHVQGYISLHAPIITANDCEGAGEVFTVKPDNSVLLKKMAKEGLSLEEAYFDKKAFLTVSAQLHLEAAVRGLGKVYSFGPTFRAENSHSRLHLAEFYMLEIETAFCITLEELTQLMEEAIKTITINVWQKCEDDLKKFFSSSNDQFMQSIMEKKYEVMSYDKALEILEANSKMFCHVINKETGFGKEHELFLVKYVGDIPVFIVDWPMHLKPFYMKQCNSDLSKVASVDLLAPRVGELCGGGLREDNYNILMEKLERLQLERSLSWYLELRKFGNVPSAGYGMGFERYLQMILGISNIKDTIPFPRWPHNCQL